MAKHDG